MRSTRNPGRSRLLLLSALIALVALALTGGAAAHGDDEPLGEHEMLIEIVVQDRFQVDELVDLEVDLAEYLRENDDGTITLNAYLTPEEIEALEAKGYVFGEVVEDHQNWLDRLAERELAMAEEQAASDFAEGEGVASHPDEGSGLGLFSLMAAPEIQPPAAVTIGRADYFENYAGRFLSVEARRAGTSTGSSPTLSFAWRTEEGSYGSSSSMSIFNDASQYMYHRQLIRIGAAGSTGAVPAYVRVATSTGGVAEREVRVWPGSELPPLEGFLTGFFNSYMDPSQVTARFESLAAEFPNIAELVELPNKTRGFGWPTAIMSGTTAIATAPSTTAQNAAVILYSKVASPAGETTRAQFRNPGQADSPLTVTVTPNALGGGTGNDIIVDLATNASGSPVSTAIEVRDAINAHPAASELVDAGLYPTRAGTGTVAVRALVALDDGYNIPAHIRTGPFTSKMLRISTRPAAGEPDERGERVGIYLYCQQHAREWVTPITCLETAERLLRNYGTHAETTEFVDNLDIFIFPSVNPDGSHLSMLSSVSGGSGGSASKRTNMANHCTNTTAAPTSGNRNAWGVDLNRNNFWGNGQFGYAGTSTSCTGETNRGPFPHSEPENQNEVWVSDTFKNIKFANNIHTYGGYFMWAPGAYINAGRVTLPAPNIGEEGYFFQAADTVLERIKQYRGTVVLPQRTGPIADVLYSAGGNSADQQWYENGIIAYSFEAGSDRFSSTTSGTGQSAVGFQPNFANEGRHEAMEFANGNYGLFEAALAYARDDESPEARMKPHGGITDGAPIESTFEWVNEPSKIYYTYDGSEPTTDSTLWQAERPRQPGQRFLFTESTTVRWLAVDMKGNESTGSVRFTIDSTDPTIEIVTPEDEGQYLLDSEHEVEFSCDDDDAGIVRCEGTQDSGDSLDTSSIGNKTFTVEAEDAAGNTSSTTVTYNVHWPFGGITPPFGVRNEVQAGSAFPVRFSLGGDWGLDVFAAGYPKSKVCGEDDSTLESTTTAEDFSYADGDYKYVWKTRPQWKGQCRELVLRFIDNTEQRATFEFKQ